jgi:hypothetical protein
MSLLVHRESKFSDKFILLYSAFLCLLLTTVNMDSFSGYLFRSHPPVVAIGGYKSPILGVRPQSSGRKAIGMEIDLDYLEDIRSISPCIVGKSAQELSLPDASIPLNLGRIQKPHNHTVELNKLYLMSSAGKNSSKKVAKDIEDKSQKSMMRSPDLNSDKTQLLYQSVISQVAQGHSEGTNKDQSFSTSKRFRRFNGRNTPGVIRVYNKDKKSSKSSERSSNFMLMDGTEDSFLCYRRTLSPLGKHLMARFSTSSPTHKPKNTRPLTPFLTGRQSQVPTTMKIYSKDNENILRASQPATLPSSQGMSRMSRSPETLRERFSTIQRGQRPIETNVNSTLLIKEYDGDFSNDVRQGAGRVNYANGDWYEGQWNNNKRHGQGVYFYKKLSVKYVGEWEDNTRHGRGTLTFSNGDTIEGNWKRDTLKSDNGHITYSKGGHYSGQLNDGYRHGDGILVYENDVKYAGKWRNDIREGPGRLELFDSWYFQGYFKNDSTEKAGVLIKKNALPCINDTICKASYDEMLNTASHVLQLISYSSVYSRSKFTDEFSMLDTINIRDTDIIWITLNSQEVTSRNLFDLEPGKFLGGKLQGAGLISYGMYGHYQGNFKDSKRHGMGRMVYTAQSKFCALFEEAEGVYEGQWSNDLRHGKGIMKWSNGIVYEGSFAFNRRHKVQGKVTFVNKESYEGYWLENVIHGIGSYTTKEGITYRGKFANGVPNKLGTLMYPDSSRYEGQIMNWKPDGKGRIIKPNNDIYEGNFENGQFQGQGKIHYANGDSYSGEWLQGTREGQGTMFYAQSEEIYEGSWKDDKRNGTGRLLNRHNQTVFFGSWKDDQREGPGKIEAI